MTSLRILPAKRVAGEIRVPPDKSITHRALILGSLAEDESYVRTPLMALDCLATLKCVEQLGCRIEEDGPGLRLMPGDMISPHDSLDCGNSGTTMRLLAGAIASHDGVTAHLVGDESLSRRPMRRVAEPLQQMGAVVTGDTAPLHIEGRKLQGWVHELKQASAQVKSALLIAGLRASRETSVQEPFLSRDHTERFLRATGASIHVEGTKATVEPGPIRGFEVAVPGDVSSATYWMVAATLLRGSELVLLGLGTNPTRFGLRDVMGAHLENERFELQEPVADLVIERPSKPMPFTIQGELVPRLIDEIPILSVLATQLDGVSVIKDAQELRVKESDRVSATVDFLTAMGAHVEATEDGLTIEGPTPLHGASVDPRGDHRIAMSAAIAGLVAEGQTVVQDTQCIATSYPDFVHHLEKLIER